MIGTRPTGLRTTIRLQIIRILSWIFFFATRHGPKAVYGTASLRGRYESQQASPSDINEPPLVVAGGLLR